MDLEGSEVARVTGVVGTPTAAIFAPIGTPSDVPIRLDDAAPVYQQLHDRFAADIASGRLAPGTRLPPTRTLATRLGVHRNTLVRAFALLESNGWIDATPGRGSFVRPPPWRGSTATAPTAPSFAPDWSHLLSRAVRSEPLDRIVRLSAPRPEAGQPAPIDLARMQPSPDLIPDRDFADCLNAVFARLGPHALAYAPSQGDPDLRALIAADLARAGLVCAPDDIVVTTGSQQGLDLVARALVNPGDVFLTESRTYSGALTLLAASGARVVGVATDDDGPLLADLDDAIDHRAGRAPVKGLYLVPNARHPTGTSIAPQRRAAILAWARRRGVPVIEDDYGADLVLEPHAAMAPLRALDPEVVHLGTFSKKLMPALRVGFLVVPQALRDALLALKHTMDLGTSPLLQHALAEYLRRGLLGPHLARIQATYRHRRDLFVAALRRYLPPDIVPTVPLQGVATWLPLPPTIDPDLLALEAARAGVLVAPGSVFSTEHDAGIGLRLTFSAENDERLVEGARRLGLLLQRALGRREAPPALVGV